MTGDASVRHAVSAANNFQLSPLIFPQQRELTSDASVRHSASAADGLQLAPLVFPKQRELTSDASVRHALSSVTDPNTQSFGYSPKPDCSTGTNNTPIGEPFGELLHPEQHAVAAGPLDRATLVHGLETSESADLLRQIELSSRELESQLAALRNSPSSNSDLLEGGQAKLHHLNSLRDQLVGGAKSVATLRAEITAAVSATHAYALSVSGVVGRVQTSPAEQAAQAALREASVAAHQTVDNFERDFYGRKIFDPYLKFASAGDEDEYRRREQERQRAIEKAQAENTPEGNLRATKLAIAQLEDAGAHGADQSPDYRRTLDGLKHSERTLDARLSHAPDDKGATERLSVASAPATKAGIVPPDLADAFRGAGVIVTDPATTGGNAALPGALRATAAQHGAGSH